MNAEILCIGTELLLGDIVNTNAQYLSRKLAQKGINVFYQSSIGDNPDRIVKSLSAAISRSNLIIITGGLGPTADDITMKTVSDALGIPLERNEEAYEHIVEYFKRIGRPMTPNNEKQAYLPKGCTIFENKKGTAPGCAIESGTQCIIFLPGPPSEMQAMYEDKVSRYLNKYSSGIIESKFVKIYGVGEAAIDQKAADLINGTDPTVAPYAKLGEAELRVTAKGETKQEAIAKIDETVFKIKSLFGECVYGFDDDDLQTVVVRLLKEKKLKVSTAESCTAGYISKRITDISGSSEVFNMGVVTYSNESKTMELSVPPELIEKHGAVSKEVAACMAKGVRLKSGADIGLSITGIAGPTSDGSNKPVGLSYIGLSTNEGEFVIESQKGGKNDREYIRYTSASEALNFLRLYLENGLKNSAAEKTQAVLLNEVEENEKLKEKNTTKSLKMSGVMPTFSEKEVASLQPEDDEDIVSEKVEFGAFSQKENKNSNNNFEQKLQFKKAEFSEEEELEFQKLDEQLQSIEKKQKKETKKKHRFFYHLFIHKGDGAKEVFRKIIFWIALLAFIYATYTIGYYYINPLVEQSKISQAEKEYRSQTSVNYYGSEINPKFRSLYKKNKDIIGWITIDGTNIDYPVMQSKDEEFYLRKGFDKSYSREGMIFASKNSSIKYKKESQNIMLYGHHMKSTGTMFKELDRYFNISFYKKNPIIVFDSLYRDSQYKIFAVMITNPLPHQDNGNVFDYQKTKFSTKKEFDDWIKEARIRSIYNTFDCVDIEPSDEILTLQTCNDSFGKSEDEDKARLIIMARRVRVGEEATIDTSKAELNPNPKYPQAWYDVNNKINPYKNTEETTKSTTKKAKNN